MAKLSLTSKLSALPIECKLIWLAGIALILFLPNLLLRHVDLKIYYMFYAFFVSALAGFGFVVIGKKNFIAMLKLWGIGAVIYLLFAVPRIYWAGSLSPYFDFTSLTDRWLYSLLLPLILLGTFTASLVFVRITSPAEFLKWGYGGLKITLLMRALQHSAQVFSDTRIALMLQNQWPDEGSSIFNLRTSWLVIKSSHLLVSTAFRNIILYWFPWGWLCFKKNIGALTRNNKKFD
jgi:hypothetical protein